LRFDLSWHPAGSVIGDAPLNLYQTSGVGPTVTGYAVQVTSSWNEAQATWNNRMTGTPWGTAGGDINIHVIGQVSLDNTAGWRSWNVTQLVDLWYRGRLPNNGLMLAAISTGANADKTFFSSDYAVDSTRRPRLDLSYRILGATGVYVSKVGGPGTMAQWQSISWNASARSLVADEFNGGSLDPKWTWINPPAAQDVGVTTPGHLHVVSTTGLVPPRAHGERLPVMDERQRNRVGPPGYLFAGGRISVRDPPGLLRGRWHVRGSARGRRGLHASQPRPRCDDIRFDADRERHSGGCHLDELVCPVRESRGVRP